MTNKTKTTIISIVALVVLATTIVSCTETTSNQAPVIEEAKIVQGSQEDFIDFVGPEGNIVYFGYDGTKLSEDELNKIDIQVGWIKLNPTSPITIEGHCDNRGKNSYNQKLGLLRADSVKSYLIESGVVNPIYTFSWGEESPAYDNCETDFQGVPLPKEEVESCHSKNRRAETIIKIGE